MVSRYGKKGREKKKEIIKKSKKKYMCPICNRKKVRRVANGIWMCEKCKTKFASDAYEFNA